MRGVQERDWWGPYGDEFPNRSAEHRHCMSGALVQRIAHPCRPGVITDITADVLQKTFVSKFLRRPRASLPSACLIAVRQRSAIRSAITSLRL